ncbi:MAG: choice-of-anchor tandem repeat GloVer-containing protein [Candidatus Baltobacteraceae bacterium]
MRTLSFLLIVVALAGCARTGALSPLPEAASGLDAAQPLANSGYRALYSFGKNYPDGALPASKLLYFQGRFYGTTSGGGDASGNCRCGAVYSITPSGDEKMVYAFQGRPDGFVPMGDLAMLNGSLFGTTMYGGKGGVHKCFGDQSGCGIVYKIDPSGRESTLYAFSGGADGANPAGGLLVSNRKLYGTTTGGTVGHGTVFTMGLSGTQHVLYNFKGIPSDGSYPVGTLVDFNGNFYGVTELGGAYNVGTVFQVKHDGTERVVHSFSSSEGEYPIGLVALHGVLYGTTEAAGLHKRGTVFAITPGGDFHVVYAFKGFPQSDGAYPAARPIAVNGVLFGTTGGGGAHGEGTIYRLTTSGDERVLHSCRPRPSGVGPGAALSYFDGVLYGTTVEGGADGSKLGEGTVFRIRP